MNKGQEIFSSFPSEKVKSDTSYKEHENCQSHNDEKEQTTAYVAGSTGKAVFRHEVSQQGGQDNIYRCNQEKSLPGGAHLQEFD